MSGKMELKIFTVLMGLLILTSIYCFSWQPTGITNAPNTVSAATTTYSAGDPLWNKTYGGTSGDLAYSVVKSSDGGFAMAGYTKSFGAGSYDFWLVKTNSTGHQQWNKTFGGTDDDQARCVIQTSDGGYALAGWTNSFGAGSYDFWLVKTNSSGNQVWNKTYGATSDDEAKCVVQTSDGGYFIAGDKFVSSSTNNDFWVVKTDSSGNQQWNKTYGGTGYDFAYSAVQTSDGGYAIAGITNSGISSYDMWLVKTDSSGNQQWNKTYGGPQTDCANSLIKTTDGGYALAGYTDPFNSDTDAWLVKTDSSGNQQWNKTYAGFGDDLAQSLVQTSDGGYALAGFIGIVIPIVPGDVWLIKTNSVGNQIWNTTLSGSSEDGAYSVVQTSDGGYAVGGYTASYGAGNYDFWLVKFSGDPISLTVTSAHGNPNPSAGVSSYNNGTSVTCSVSSPVTEGSNTYLCTGWTGTGSVPSSGSSTTTTFTITQTSSITWNWQLQSTPTPPPSSGGSDSSSSSTASSSSSSSPTPAPTPSPTPTPTPAPPTVVQAVTDSGATVSLAITGNLTSSQISSASIVTDQADATVTVSFSIAGEPRSTGFSNITIPKSSVQNGVTPQIYIDGKICANQGYTEDASNFYVWFTAHFSTHQVAIVFKTTSQNSAFSPLIAIAVVVVAVVCIATAVVVSKRKKKK